VAYLVAILPVAIGWGVWPAGIVALASFLTYDWSRTAPCASTCATTASGAHVPTEEGYSGYAIAS
jgi:K+-sensing histidine kinase KdpD